MPYSPVMLAAQPIKLGLFPQFLNQGPKDVTQQLQEGIGGGDIGKKSCS